MLVNNQYNVPLVYGNCWTKEIVEDCKKKNKLLRVAMAIPGGEKYHECNMNCIFCFTECGTRNQKWKNIDNETVLKFAEEVQPYVYDKDIMNYYFVSEGEPTLNKDLCKVLTKISSYGGTMTIFSNLYELTDEQIETFKNLKNLFVCGKMYGYRPETNDYLTNIKGSHKQMMENIKKLIDAGLAEEGRLGVQCVVTSTNCDEIFDIFKWARKHNIAPHIMLYREQGLGKKFPELAITQEKLRDIFKKCSEYDKANNIEWSAKLPLLVIGDCSVPGINLYLTTNGDVHVCAGDTRKYGNYFENTIEEMMNSDLYKEVLTGYKKCPWVTI